MKNDGQLSWISTGRSGGRLSRLYLFIMLFLSISAVVSFRVFAADAPSYHTYDTMLSELRRLAKAHPKIGKLHDLGASSDGRTRVWAFKISDNVAKEEDEPTVLLTGGVHGNERVSSEMAIFTIRRLLSDRSHRELIGKTQIWVIPGLNERAKRAKQMLQVVNRTDAECQASVESSRSPQTPHRPRHRRTVTRNQISYQ